MSTAYLETNSLDPCFNLAFEEYVLEHKTRGDWLILWQNANTVVVGLNQNTAEEIDPEFVRAHGVSVVRRRTGGGAVYHDLGNLNYSFITDVGDAESLTIARFTEPVCRALRSLGLDARTTGRNDVTVEGKKVSGVAQRICGERILHHGTLLFDSDPELVAGALRADPTKFASKSAKSVRSRIGNIRAMLPADMTLPQFWARLLAELTAEGLDRRELTEAELELVRSGAERYRDWDWTYGRSPECDYANRARFPGGTLEVRLGLKGGVIVSADFRGDFMARRDADPARAALVGLRYDRETAAAALSPLELESMFGSLSLEDILDTMFGGAPHAAG